MSSLTVAYNANTGQDAAGTAFGFAYQDSARALVDAAAKGVNAVRHIGYLIQGSAVNYSRAEAAADLRGGASPLTAPVTAPEYAAPGTAPDVNGPGQTPPLLWYLVEALVGDWWPNGSPGELRAAAAAWNAFAAPLYGVGGQNAGAYATIGAQQMPDKEPMQQAVREVGTAMSSLAGEAQQLASQLSSFATDVATTQNAIRDLLGKLTSVVGSVIDRGVMGTVFELLSDDAEEKIQQVADDIKAVIANHKRQSAARKDLLTQLVNGIKNYTRAMEIITRVELVNYLGEDAGRVVANINDAVTDTSVGIALGGINTVGGLVTGFDPVGDPKGVWATIQGLNKMAQTLNPMSAPTSLVTDPRGSIDMVKAVTHFDDIFTGNRPFVGVGELGFDIGTAVVPGGGGAKAVGGVRAAEGAAARSEIATGERAASRAAGIASVTGGLRNVARDADGVAARLGSLSKTTLDGGKPASAPPSAHSISAPVTHAPETAVAAVPHSGDLYAAGLGDQPNNPPHTGLHDPPANHGVPGGQLPDLSDINSEYRLSGGAVDPARFDEWTEKVSERYEPISPRGVAGVYDYSSELHQGMNPYLRDVAALSERQQSVLGVDSLSDLTPEQRALWEQRISRTDEGLAALPPYRADPTDLASTTWRGMRVSDSLLAQLDEGAIFSDPGYLSTTTDSFVAESFARGALPGETPILIEVVGADGVNVSQLSQYMDESEILFPRGSRFEILSRQVGDDGVLRMTMKQVK
ncbi:ADP-ribosyltransferase [Mycobacterium sp. shizuoka-1]|uniref:ADP-ribosyltransferase n=1 Tax=Mycobacterium sp. shizuoka-1 TaxID=2039281 RepID=UPI000C07A2DD|nr:ADP-ribosyltransferase [Mycobacterium sp. shizuoka-1]